MPLQTLIHRPLAGLALLSLAVAGARGCGEGATAGTPADSTAAPSPNDTTPVALRQMATGLDFPLFLTAPPGDPRLFVVEKGGRIRVVRDGRVLDAPFLDLSGRVSTGSEQGLLGLAFDPRYATTGRFYVDFTDRDGNTHVARFTASADPDRADPASEQTLLTVAQPYANHNGGEVAFGPDGYLYVGLGDGGSGGDPHRTGQDPSDLLGAILRIDPGAPSGGLPYTIPADNPYVGRAGARGELWAIGLRNPWRFGWDRETGDLYIADVGQNRWEEVDVAPATNGRGAGRGANYGWNVMEGAHCYGSGGCDTAGLVRPAVEYGHDDGCSITGGYVYRGRAIPALRGHYVYADFCSGWVRSFRYAGGRAVEQQEWPSLRPGGSITSFGEDAAGELYVLESGGSVWRIVPR